MAHCDLMPPGKMKDICQKTYGEGPYANGANPPSNSGGGSFFGIPLPGSDWLRHFMFRAAEVIVGVAMIVVGIKAFTSSSATTKVIVQQGSKVTKKL